MTDIIVRTVVLDEISCKETKTSKKNNKSYCSVGIKIGGKWYNGVMWGDQIDIAKQWKERDSIILAFFQEEWEGKMQSKFKLPTKVDMLSQRMTNMEAELKLIKDHLKT